MMKLSDKLLKEDPYHLTPPPGSSGTSTSSKTPGRDLEDRWSLDRVCDIGSWWNFLRSFWMMIPIIWHTLQDSREGLGGKVESWQGFWCWFLMKLSQKLLKYDPYHMTPPPGSSGISTSSKTPGRDLEDRWSLDRVSAVSKFFRNLHILQDSRQRLGGQVESWQGFWF